MILNQPKVSLNTKSLLREKTYKHYLKKFYVWIRAASLKICKCSKAGLPSTKYDWKRSSRNTLLAILAQFYLMMRTLFQRPTKKKQHSVHLFLVESPGILAIMIASLQLQWDHEDQTQSQLFEFRGLSWACSTVAFS